MASGKSDYLEDVLLDLVLGGSTWTPPATVYLALSTAAYSASATGAAMTEVTGVDYARAAVPNDAANWPAAALGVKTNGSLVEFPNAGAGGWGTVLSFYVCDAATGGNVLYGGDLTNSRTIAEGDKAVFQTGSLTFTED